MRPETLMTAARSAPQSKASTSPLPTVPLTGMVPVTRPFLPPLSELLPHLERIWDSHWVTNVGPYHQQLEAALAEYLDVPQVALFCNGTVALIVALQALRVGGEVITTPYSFAATAHALLWNELTPVFADVDPNTANLDPARVEEAITPRTRAILAVHCYGNPCDVEALQRIADTYGLTLIYDAAHAFGVQWRGESLLLHGDGAVLSFHATKVYHTFEGGAIVCRDAKLKQRIDYLKNFGFADEVTIVAPGINGKMSEFNAAFGLVHLAHMDEVLAERRAIVAHYREALADVPGIRYFAPMPDTVENGAYFPIFVGEEYPLRRDALYWKLREAGIYARRYFYPLLSNLPMYRGLPSAARERLPVANRLAEEVLCLPVYAGLEETVVERVIEIVRQEG